MAKARRRPVQNPSIPRLEWVAKTYPDAVWLLTVFGFMEAAGLDDARSDFEGEGEAVVDRIENGMEATYNGDFSDGVAYQIREYEAENTEYDRYIPWLAKSLNRVTKKPVKKLKEVFEKAYPGLLFDRGLPHVAERMAEDDVALSKIGRKVDRKESDPTTILVDAFTVTHSVRGNPLMDAWYYLDEAAHTEADGLRRLMVSGVSELISSFGTVVRWAEGDGVNLDDYEPLEAVELAKEWAARQPKDPNIVAGDVVYEFDDGWTFQELTTRPQFMCEGKYLDHCVKGYKPSKVGVVYRIFSLRDAQGRPVATLRWEIGAEYVGQYYGMSNTLPERDAVERAIEFRRGYIDENLVAPENKLGKLGDGDQIPWGNAFAWEVWKQTGGAHSGDDSLVNQAAAYVLPYNTPTRNPSKRKAKGKPNAAEALLKRSHRLWETYDAMPLKKHLVAFGKHVERMQASGSAKVKAESRHAARAFNAEFKERGWKR